MALIHDPEYFTESSLKIRAEKYGFSNLFPLEFFVWDMEIAAQIQGVSDTIILKGGAATQLHLPDRYAAIITKDVDDYFVRKFELDGDVEEAEKNITCPRCRNVNFPQTLYCRRCGMPLSNKARKHDETIDDIIAKILLDPEVSRRLRDELLEVKAR
jgi:ribosomal protein L37E